MYKVFHKLNGYSTCFHFVFRIFLFLFKRDFLWIHEVLNHLKEIHLNNGIVMSLKTTDNIKNKQCMLIYQLSELMQLYLSVSKLSKQLNIIYNIPLVLIVMTEFITITVNVHHIIHQTLVNFGQEASLSTIIIPLIWSLTIAVHNIINIYAWQSTKNKVRVSV